MCIDIGWLALFAVVLVAIYWRLILGHPKGLLHQCECGDWHENAGKGSSGG